MNKLATCILAAALPGAALADGAALFADNCAACHAEGGVGTPGLAPPLVDAELWTRLGPKAPDYIAGVLTSGLTGRITVAAVDYIGLAMPEQTQLTPAEMAEVASYVLQTLNGLEQPVTEELAAATLASPPDHAALRKLRKGE